MQCTPIHYAGKSYISKSGLLAFKCDLSRMRYTVVSDKVLKHIAERTSDSRYMPVEKEIPHYFFCPNEELVYIRKYGSVASVSVVRNLVLDLFW
jgi:hypothetical protein